MWAEYGIFGVVFILSVIVLYFYVLQPYDEDRTLIINERSLMLTTLVSSSARNAESMAVTAQSIESIAESVETLSDIVRGFTSEVEDVHPEQTELLESILSNQLIIVKLVEKCE